MKPPAIQTQGAGAEAAEIQAAPEVAAPVQAEGAAIQASQSLLDVYA